MHTHTDATFLHRHWVIAPAFALIAALSLSPILGSSHLSASVAAPIIARADTPFAFANGLKGLAYQGAIVDQTADGLTLGEGSVLMSSDGVFQMHIGNVSVLGFASAAHVTNDPQSITVVALDGPLVITQGTDRMFLPTGSQILWKKNEVPHTALAIETPVELRTEYLQVLDGVPAAAQVARGFPVDLRMNPADADAWEIIAQLRDAATKGDALTITSLIHDHRATLASRPGLIRSLLHADVRESIVLELLTLLPVDDGLMVLAPLHPLLREAAWTQDRAFDTSVLLAVPQADLRAQAAPAFVVDRWTQALRRQMEESDDPVALLQELIETMEPVRIAFEARTFPERRARYGDALQSLAEPFADDLNDDAAAKLHAWKNDIVITEPIIDETSVSSVPSIPSIPSPSLDPSTLESTASALLRNAGALFGLPTAIHAADSGLVAVQSLIFSAPDGEHLYDFVLNPADATVSSIRKDGEVFPLSMTLDAFAQWAKGE